MPSARAQLHALEATPPATGSNGPGVSRASLQTDLLAAGERAARLHSRVLQLEKRLSEALIDGGPRLRRWAHMLGYDGNYLTKSRRYCVTFGQLRAARTQHRRAQRHPDGETDPWGRDLDETVVLILADWHYAGTGYHTSGDRLLALSAAARARDHDSWAAAAA